MKKRRFVIDYIIIGTLLVFTIGIGIYFKHTGKDCGLAGVDSVDDIKAGMVTLDYAIKKDDPWGTGGIQRLMDQIEQAKIIIIAKPTGKLIQSDGTYGQEILVKQILRGEEHIMEGEKTWFYQSFGFRAIDDKIRFMNAYLNIMNLEEEYLVFLEPSPLNDYQQETVYELSNEVLGYICLKEMKTKNLPEKYKEIDYVELKEYEFFAVSEKLTTELNEVRKAILEKYIMNENEK